MIRFSLSKSKLNAIFKSKITWLVLTFVFTIPAFVFLLRPGIYYNMHDDMQMIRQLELDKCLHDGQIPCRWTPDLGYGYGYPLFNFYPPMPYFVGQVFRTLTFNYMDSIKLMGVTQIVLSAVFMFILASSLFGNIGGFIASLFYTYAPYHAVNVYVRGAYNEAWASVWFPLILFFSKKLIETKKTIHMAGLAVSFAFLMLSHNPMVLTFSPFLVIWCLFWILTTYRLNLKKIDFKPYFPIIIKLVGGAVLAVSLAAFFFLPILFETNLVKIDTMFEGYYNYSVHFTSIHQLFISTFWGDGPSVWGQADGMSFMIGYLHWILPLLISAVIIFRIFKRQATKLDFVTLMLVAMGFFAAFMTHERSTFLWMLFTPIQKIQFPWRFLSHVDFFLSLAAGALVLYLPRITLFKVKHLQFIIPTIVVVILLALNVKYFTPIQYGPLTDNQKFSGKAWTNLVTSGIYDYLPKTAAIAPQSAANFPIDGQSPKDTVVLNSFKQGTDWFLVNLDTKENADITLAQIYFPNFKIFDNDKEIKFTIEPTLGRMVVNLPKGHHQLFVKLYDTPVRQLGNFVSLVAWLGLLIYLLSLRWPHKQK